MASQAAAAVARSAAAVTSRSAAAVTSRSAAACHGASDIRCVAPRFPGRGFAADSTLTAAWTRPPPSHAAAAAPSGPRLLRGGLATLPGYCYPPPGSDRLPLSWFDPEAPVDPATYLHYGEEDLASEEALWALYERWCSFYNMARSRDDMLRRFGGFKDRARRIHEFNKSGASYTQALNKIADQTAEERAKFLSGRCI